MIRAQAKKGYVYM
jgi:hypothetical protein